MKTPKAPKAPKAPAKPKPIKELQNRLNNLFGLKRMVLVGVLAFASIAHAGTVYFSEHGKTFHTSEKCMSLARTKRVLHAEEADAVAHGLKACGICQRAKKSNKTKTGNGAWAQ
jgi:hypothetical protein